MPLYEYACTDCDHRFEILQRIGDGGNGLACPACGSEGLEKQFSTFASGSSEGGGSLGAGGGAPLCGPGFT